MKQLQFILKIKYYDEVCLNLISTNVKIIQKYYDNQSYNVKIYNYAWFYEKNINILKLINTRYNLKEKIIKLINNWILNKSIETSYINIDINELTPLNSNNEIINRFIDVSNEHGIKWRKTMQDYLITNQEYGEIIC
jgi:hypothetical protein